MRPRQKVSRAGLELIKSFEGLRRTAARLPDGRWTIGYGHTLSAREGAVVDAEQAELLLIFDLRPVADAVNDLVTAPLTQNQFDALAAFAFNIGVESFRQSLVLKRVNQGRTAEAACSIDLWRRADVDGDPVVLDALIRRRAAEKSLFLTPEGGFVATPSALLRPEVDEVATQSLPTSIPVDIETSMEGLVAEVHRLPLAEGVIEDAPEPETHPVEALSEPVAAPEALAEPVPEPQAEAEPAFEPQAAAEPELPPAVAITTVEPTLTTLPDIHDIAPDESVVVAGSEGSPATPEASEPVHATYSDVPPVETREEAEVAAVELSEPGTEAVEVEPEPELAPTLAAVAYFAPAEPAAPPAANDGASPPVDHAFPFAPAPAAEAPAPEPEPTPAFPVQAYAPPPAPELSETVEPETPAAPATQVEAPVVAAPPEPAPEPESAPQVEPAPAPVAETPPAPERAVAEAAPAPRLYSGYGPMAAAALGAGVTPADNTSAFPSDGVSPFGPPTVPVPALMAEISPQPAVTPYSPPVTEPLVLTPPPEDFGVETAPAFGALNPPSEIDDETPLLDETWRGATLIASRIVRHEEPVEAPERPGANLLVWVALLAVGVAGFGGAVVALLKGGTAVAWTLALIGVACVALAVYYLLKRLGGAED